MGHEAPTNLAARNHVCDSYVEAVGVRYIIRQLVFTMLPGKSEVVTLLHEFDHAVHTARLRIPIAVRGEVHGALEDFGRVFLQVPVTDHLEDMRIPLVVTNRLGAFRI